VCIRLQDQKLPYLLPEYAGPFDAEDGTKAGTVYIGTWYQDEPAVKEFHFTGDRKDVRMQAVNEAIRFALERITQSE